ncbi:5-formyltetrahydrofolate cyclo-ligase [Ornithinibacillus scapharcae]|uniref:5-formyltetrahydrofolate cyclo-ligase n=1 Tax=Ornithinibacillus scapharcae TaxID=1147159 RepID=UPI000225B386|nr:5-formyltetrahydrofolate cyclo-ligase [Ornithinibacillus scapharcae]
MGKKEIRDSIIKSLQDLSDEDKRIIELQLYQHLFESEAWKNSTRIGITISRGMEWDTRAIIEEGWKQGKEIVVPKCIPGEKKLLFYRLHHFSELETVYYNLLEPKPLDANLVLSEQIELVIVPGVVFNKKGYRIGFGGGYYDRFLSTYNGHTLSLLSRLQLMDDIPIESHDIPVKQLITEAGIVK